MEFLRPTDTDIKSALHTLIGPAAEPAIPAPDLTPAPILEADSSLEPPPKTEPAINSTAGPNLVVDQQASAPFTNPPPNLEPGLNLRPSVGINVNLEVSAKSTPAFNSITPVRLKPPVSLHPGINLTGPRKRNFAIREATTAADGHSRAEHDVYQALWNEGTPQLDGSRLITIGMLNLGRLAGLSESNARINLRSLQRKLAVEEHSTFVCENSQGRTWRVFSPDQILARRRAAGLIWYMKRTLAVVFVDPETGYQLTKGA